MDLRATRVVWAFTAIFAIAGCGAAVEEAVAEDDNKVAETADTGSDANITDDISKASYVIGFGQVQQILGQIQVQSQGVIDVEAFTAGAQDALAGAESQIDMESAQASFEVFQEAVQVKVTEAQAAQAEMQAAAVAKGAEFRAEFEAKDGVQKTASGLLYEVMKEGSGPKPTASDTVVTHYHGTLTSGEVFDSSVDRGQPASFSVGGVISGWTEALQMMNVGSKWRLVIPPELAYGERGAGQMIGPNTTLVFEVELLEIKGAE